MSVVLRESQFTTGRCHKHRFVQINYEFVMKNVSDWKKGSAYFKET
jgi:hypothetical protein